MGRVRREVLAGRPVRREGRAVRVAPREVAHLVEEVEEPGAALMAPGRDRVAPREQVEDQIPVAQEAVDREGPPRAARVRPALVGLPAAAPPAAQLNTRPARSALIRRV